VILGNLSQNLPIKLNVRFSESADKPAVGGSFFPKGGVQLSVPKGAEISLLFLASAEGVLPGVNQSFFRELLFGLPSPLEAFGVFKNPFSFFVGNRASFYSRHVFIIPKLSASCRRKRGRPSFSCCGLSSGSSLI